MSSVSPTSQRIDRSVSDNSSDSNSNPEFVDVESGAEEDPVRQFDIDLGAAARSSDSSVHSKGSSSSGDSSSSSDLSSASSDSSVGIRVESSSDESSVSSSDSEKSSTMGTTKLKKFSGKREDFEAIVSDWRSSLAYAKCEVFFTLKKHPDLPDRGHAEENPRERRAT